MHNNVFVITTERKLSEIGIKSQIKKTLPKNSVCVSCIANSDSDPLAAQRSLIRHDADRVARELMRIYFA